MKTHKSVGLARRRERIMIVASYGSREVYETFMYPNENERVQTQRVFGRRREFMSAKRVARKDAKLCYTPDKSEVYKKFLRSN